MALSPKQILAHHRPALYGRLRYRYLNSEVLGLRKPFYVYEPPEVDRHALPVLYLLRGHEREWVNPAEDASRARTAIEDLDALIAQGDLPPLVAVLPGLNSSNNHVPSLGIDMVGPWKDDLRGLGTGRFWQYLTDELIPTLDAEYAPVLRLAAGFSLGGYTGSLLATHRPGTFAHVGLYDGLFMWPGHRDPRRTGAGTGTDTVWCRAGIFDAAFGQPRSTPAFHRWNPTDAIRRADAATLARIRQTTFWIKSASADGREGNLDRSRFFARWLREHGIPVGTDEVVLHPKARHTWYWADRFLVQFLRRVLPAG